MIYFIVDAGSDPYMSVVLTGLIEIPITVAAWYIVKTVRRKTVYNIAYPTCLASTIALLATGKGEVSCRARSRNLLVDLVIDDSLGLTFWS